MDWGQAVVNNGISWGRGYSAANGWGSVYTVSASGDTALTA